jgi:hypothetical protein
MKPSDISTENRALLLASLSAVPLLIWWLGWFPGFLSTDSIDQLGQVDRFDFFNFHPILHTFSMWVVTRIWDHPGAVTLLQVLLLAGLLGFVARRLVQVGVPWWLAVGAAWITAALPMVAATTITIWKDIPYSLAMVWAFAELLALARDRKRFWSSWWGPLRLGAALGLLWALRGNGKVTVLIFAVALAIGFRHQWRKLLAAGGAIVGVGIAIPTALLTVLPVNPGTIEPAEVFLPDVAAVVVNDLDWFSDADRARLEAIAPLDVWQSRYECSDSTPLVFDPNFNNAPPRDDPWTYRSLVARTAITHLPTVLGHRLCAASFLFVPWPRDGSYLHRPPFEIPPNTLGIARDSISGRAYSFTLAQYQWIEKPGVEWLTWRPALVILAGIATYIGVAIRRRLRPLLWAGGLIGAQLLNVAAMTPAHEFRYAFGIYLLCLMSLPFWWLIARPGEAAIERADRLDSPL